MMPSAEERLVFTGMLGDVMRESAQAAVSYVWSNAEALDIDPKLFEGKTIYPQGRAVGGSDHHDRADLTGHPAAGAERCGHDGRDHVARQGAAGGRHQGEGPGSAPRRDQGCHPAQP
jgi:ATP-dependent Lon protease